jgi:hypothetical protein
MKERRMQCGREGVVALLCLAFLAAATARADDDFLAGMSTIVTREARKQVKDKKIPFTLRSLKGELRAVEPEQYLHVEVTSFELAGDVLQATATLKGRFQVDAKVDEQTDVSAVFDVRCGVTAEVKFTKEGGKFFVEPTVKDMDLGLTVLDISRSDLQGGEEFLSSLAVAAFKKNKDQVIAQINKRIGKRPF